MNIHSVVACCINNGIGYKGQMAWNLPNEHKYFMKLIDGNPPEGKKNVVIMGRKTWESNQIRQLTMKNHYIIVISGTMNRNAEGPDAVVSSLQELEDLLKSEQWKDNVHEIFNGGGTGIYKMVHDSPHCGRVYLTRIDRVYKCDTFFPKLGDEFQLVPTENFSFLPQGIQDDDGVKWKVEVYEKLK